jgi:SPP1 gp7 family putative phage head morphogenesis protein
MTRPARKTRIWLYPWSIEREYETYVVNYTRQMESIINAETAKSLPAIIARYAVMRGDAEPPTPEEAGAYLGATNYSLMTQRMIERIRAQIVDKTRDIGLKVKTYADKVNVFNFKQWSLMKKSIDAKYGAGTVQALEAQLAAEKGAREAIASVGDLAKIRSAMAVNVFQDTANPLILEELAAFETTNIGLIGSIPEQFLPQLQNRIITAVRNGENYKVIQEEIKNAYNLPENRARLIARDQVGKLNGQLSRLRQAEIGVTEYYWRGVLDERERPHHVAREGEVFSYSKPPDDGNPGEPIQCRCWGEPKIDIFAGLTN